MRYKILFLGDIYSDKVLSPNWVSNEIHSIVSKHDVLSCNFEGPQCNIDNRKINKIGPKIKQHLSVLKTCRELGIKLFNIGNNHIFDCGSKGLSITIKKILLSGGSTSGASSLSSKVYVPHTIKEKKITIDFYSGCEADQGVVSSNQNKPGVAWINDPLLDISVLKSKAKKHFVIIQAHAGEEISLPLPEWRARYRHLIDLGADLIVGHHPHQPQGWEKYHGKYIYYSLGNFYFDHADIKQPSSGYMLSININCVKKSYTAKVLPVVLKNRRVTTDMSSYTNLTRLSKQITSKKYDSMINKLVDNLWEKYYSYYHNKSIIKSYFNIIHTKVINLPMILHNYKIESHRWTIIRAIENSKKLKTI